MSTHPKPGLQGEGPKKPQPKAKEPVVDYNDPMFRYQQNAGTVDGELEEERVGGFDDRYMYGDARRRNPKRYWMQAAMVPVTLAIFNMMIWTILVMFGAKDRHVSTENWSLLSLSLQTGLVVAGVILVAAAISGLRKYFILKPAEFVIGFALVITLSLFVELIWLNVVLSGWLDLLSAFSENTREQLRR